MKWKKIGKIFDPTEHKLPADCFAFSKSPQAVVFDNYVRIYFSSVSKDFNGKYLSRVLFVDFDYDFKTILNMSKSEVTPLGNSGCFDEHGIFPFSPLKVGNDFYAFTTGWSRRISVSVETAIGLVRSENDGVTFDKIADGPVFSNSINEPFLVCDSFVREFDHKFHMWYCYGTEWIDDPVTRQAERVYKIGHAVSSDLFRWKRDGCPIISDVLGENEAQALPTVFYFNGRYHMYFCYRNAFDFRRNKANGYKIGYAHSGDMLVWQRDDSQSGIEWSAEGWDSEMMCYPNVFNIREKVYLLYNGNEFGKYGFGLAILSEDE